MILRFCDGVDRERHVGPHRCPLEVDRRQHDDEDGEAEVGHRQGQDGQDAPDVVGDAVLAGGRDDADQDADDDRGQDRQRGQLQGDREAPDELLPDRLTRPVGAAEVAAQHDAADPLEVLQVGGPVEAELLAEGVDGGRVGVALDHPDDDVARHEPHDREDDHADQHERGDRQRETGAGRTASSSPLDPGEHEARPETEAIVVLHPLHLRRVGDVLRRVGM